MQEHACTQGAADRCKTLVAFPAEIGLRLPKLLLHDNYVAYYIPIYCITRRRRAAGVSGMVSGLQHASTRWSGACIADEPALAR